MKKMQKQINQIFLIQLFSLILFIYSFSFILGGLIAISSGFIFAQISLKPRGSQETAVNIVNRFFLAEFIKFILIIILFVLGLVIGNFNFLMIILGFIFFYILSWFLFVLLLR